jgi:uridylate kinase
MIFVYSLGGSVLACRDAASLREYAQALKELAQEHQIFVGGGRIAREYIEKARALGASEMFCNTIDTHLQRHGPAVEVVQLFRLDWHQNHHISIIK